MQIAVTLTVLMKFQSHTSFSGGDAEAQSRLAHRSLEAGDVWQWVVVLSQEALRGLDKYSSFP